MVQFWGILSGDRNLLNKVLELIISIPDDLNDSIFSTSIDNTQSVVCHAFIDD